MKKQYSPRTRLVGRDSSFVRLMLRLANSVRISSSAPGWSSAIGTRRATSCRVRTAASASLPMHDEPRLGLRVIGDVARDHVEREQLRGEVRPDRDGGALLVRDAAGRFGRRVRRDDLRVRAGSRAASAGTARSRRGIEYTSVTVERSRSRTSEQMQPDVEDHLALDAAARRSRTPRTSTVVLTVPSTEFSIGTMPAVDLAALDGEDHVLDGREVDEVDGLGVDDLQQRFLRERPRGAEEAERRPLRVASRVIARLPRARAGSPPAPRATGCTATTRAGPASRTCAPPGVR